MQADKIKQYITEEADGVTFSIDVSDRDITVAGVKVTCIGQFVSTVNEGDDEEALYSDGDLYVLWDETGMTDDAIETVMSEFYSEDAFTAELKTILLECGFSEFAVEDVCTSESGMQDEGRASYDAFAIADEVRAALA